MSEIASGYSMLRATFLREFRTAVLNRFIAVFCSVALLAGVIPLGIDQAHSGETAPVFLIQVVLYLVPLFALLIGCGSAQADIEERDFLFSFPIPRRTILLGKFFALWSLFAFASLLLVAPAGIGESDVGVLAMLWLHTSLTGGVFLALGLAIGFSTNNRVKAHLVALCAWFIFLAGFDVAALASAGFPAVQKYPALWTSLLVINPLDSLRVGQLLSVQGVPFDTRQMPVFVQWWIGHLGLSFSIISTGWILLGLGWSRSRLEYLG